MADGGVIIDDAGAAQTRIWRYEGYLDDREQMEELTEAKPVTVPANLTGFVIKYAGNTPPLCGPVSGSSKVTVEVNGQPLFTIDNSTSGSLTITSTQRLTESQSHDAVYFVDSNITSIKINGHEYHKKDTRQTLILTYT